MTGLVALGILFDESAGITIALATGSGEGEVSSSFWMKPGPPNMSNHALCVVINEPHILTCVTFNEARLFITQRVEGLNPFAIVVLGTEES
jgi:hypothetical protein